MDVTTTNLDVADLMVTIPLLILGVALMLGARLFGLLFMIGAIFFLAGAVWSVKVFSDSILLMVLLVGTGFLSILFWRTRQR